MRAVRLMVLVVAVVIAGGLPRIDGAVAAGRAGELWVARYNGVGNGLDEAVDAAVSPDGATVFVTGHSGGLADDCLTIAYDAATGHRLWLDRFNGPTDGLDQASALAVSPDGTMVFVTGYTVTKSSDDYLTIAYDAATGTRLWLSRYNGLGNDYDLARAVKVSPDGSAVYVTGESDGGALGLDFATIAYDAVSGKQLWVRRFNGRSDGADQAYDLVVSPDGSKLFVTGSSDDSPVTGFNDYATVGYDASTGDRLWVSHYNGGSESYRNTPYAVGVSPDGTRVFVTGYSEASGSYYDYATVAYEAATGEQMWASRYDGPAHSDDEAQALGVSPDGTMVFVTGFSDAGASKDDYLTVGYEANTGTALWEERLAGRKYDYAYDLAVSPDGRTVWVTGYAYGPPGGYDYTTAGYRSTTGDGLGVKRFNAVGRRADYAQAVAVSPDGSKVFVTGYSDSPSSSFDYVTVAYGG